MMGTGRQLLGRSLKDISADKFAITQHNQKVDPMTAISEEDKAVARFIAAAAEVHPYQLEVDKFPPKEMPKERRRALQSRRPFQKALEEAFEAMRELLGENDLTMARALELNQKEILMKLSEVDGVTSPEASATPSLPATETVVSASATNDGAESEVELKAYFNAHWEELRKARVGARKLQRAKNRRGLNDPKGLEEKIQDNANRQKAEIALIVVKGAPGRAYIQDRIAELFEFPEMNYPLLKDLIERFEEFDLKFDRRYFIPAEIRAYDDRFRKVLAEWDAQEAEAQRVREEENQRRMEGSKEKAAEFLAKLAAEKPKATPKPPVKMESPEEIALGVLAHSSDATEISNQMIFLSGLSSDALEESCSGRSAQAIGARRLRKLRQLPEGVSIDLILKFASQSDGRQTIAGMRSVLAQIEGLSDETLRVLQKLRFKGVDNVIRAREKERELGNPVTTPEVESIPAQTAVVEETSTPDEVGLTTENVQATQTGSTETESVEGEIPPTTLTQAEQPGSLNQSDDQSYSSQAEMSEEEMLEQFAAEFNDAFADLRDPTLSAKQKLESLFND